MMPAAGLLRLLGGAGNSAARPTPSLDPAAPSFASRLEQARAGELASGREVTIAQSSGLKLSPEQLQRLAIAADRAEAQGATRALVVMDGEAYRVDITMREVTGRADLTSPGVFTGIDAVVSMPSPADGRSPAVPLPGEGRAWSNASLLKSLAASDNDSTKVH